MPLHVAAVQLEVQRGRINANFEAAAAALRTLAARGVQLALLPEMWSTSFLEPGPDRLAAVPHSMDADRRLAALSAELGIAVAGTSYAPSPSGPHPFNRLSLFDRGVELLHYDKVHLFSPTAEHETFDAGDEPPPVVDTRFGRLSGIVCYDLRFGRLLDRVFQEQVDILLCPAQWPAPRASHWTALVRGRAVEGQCFLLASNRRGTERVGRRGLELEFPGNSQIVDPHGRVLASGRADEPWVTAEIDADVARRMRTRVPVRKDRRPRLYDTWRRGEEGDLTKASGKT